MWAQHLLERRSEADWKPLFNGKNLDGWKHVGKGGMTVEDGLIQTQGGMGLLYWTETKLGDCVVQVVYKMRDMNDNSGVFVRIPDSSDGALDAGELWL